MFLLRLSCFVLAFCCPFSVLAQSPPPLPRVPATEPAEAAKTIQLQDGFGAELVAAEPLVTDPVAMQIDENGLAYVVEMNDYPYSDKSHDQAWEEQTSEPIGRIRVLEDRDGDGTFDHSTVFADQLSWPAGIAIWKGGVYVAATPDVLYLKDTNGDRRADVRRTVFSGFRKYNVQAVMNNLQWGLDHHFYAAGSSNGGAIRSRHQDGTIRLGRSDFRFDPRTEQFEVISGGARFGNTFDDWGNRFVCNIRNPVQHVVFPARYLRRNPYLSVSSVIQDVVPSGDAIPVYQISPPEAWRVINAKRQAAAVSDAPHDSTVPKGFVTSSSGVTIYRGAAYPSEFQGNAFVGEVAGNLAVRYQMLPAGVSFEGRRPYEKVDFLASTDNWFRPVNFYNAPDGTLYVLDMYRETIEHPWSMPDDIKARVDLTSGRDRGRIYRLVPPRYADGYQPPPQPKLGTASTARLVAELENPNSWWRETAHRLLFERQDKAAEEPLRALLRDSRLPQARLHALWSLHGIDRLKQQDLIHAMSDGNENVREQAIRLAEPHVKEQEDLRTELLKAAADESPRVRFQAALTLGQVDDARATEALAMIARRDAANPWIRTAVLSSLAGSEVPFFLQVVRDSDFVAGEAGRAMLRQLAVAIAARNDATEIGRILGSVAGDAAGDTAGKNAGNNRLQETVVAGIGEGLVRAGSDLAELGANNDSRAARLVAGMLERARATALSAMAAFEDRRQAIQLLSYYGFPAAHETLLTLVDARQAAAVQIAAIDSLTSYADAEVAELLLRKYATLTPEVRGELVARLLRRKSWIVRLLTAIESNEVSAERISDVRRTLLMKDTDERIRDLATRLFAADLPGPRKEVVEQYQVALQLDGDAARGAETMKRECLICHRLGDEGHLVGPNLATIQNRTRPQLLVHILDPNREVSPNYLEFVVVTVDGRIHTGVIASETASSITLRQAEGKQQTILRADIEEIRSSGKSLMPEGLEKKVTPQQMADLLEALLASSEDAAGQK